MGERVSYYISPKQKGQTSTWARARALAEFDPQTDPYDAKFYLDKLSDWQDRYAAFLDSAELEKVEQIGPAGAGNSPDGQAELVF